MRDSKRRLFHSRLWTIATFVFVSLFTNAPAFATPDLDRLLSSPLIKFALSETESGALLSRSILGRALNGEEVLQALRSRLEQSDLEKAVALLETRLGRIELEMHREFPGIANGPLSTEQRAALRVLSHQELEAGAEELLSTRNRFLHPVADGGLRGRLRFPKGVDPSEHSGWMIQFGFESEYTLDSLAGLLQAYGPAPEFGVSADQWLSLPVAERVAFVKTNLERLFPNTRAMGGLVKISRESSLNFLPPRLLRDSTGNLEIVMKPVNTYEEWKRRVFLISENFGAGSMQGTLSVPSEAFFDQNGQLARTNANLGFLNFFYDLDTLDKLEVGAARYAIDPSKPAANSFNHSFLGPMTLMKQRKLGQYLMANSQGAMLDESALEFVASEDDSFKYVGGTAYRPDIVRGRVILEVRDAHTHSGALLERMTRTLFYLENGTHGFRPAAELPAFYSERDFDRLPEKVRSLLIRLFPEKRLPNETYSERERLALEVYRNFAYPTRSWNAQLMFLGRSDLRKVVAKAQASYVAKLNRVAEELAAGAIDARQASLRVQGALVEFSRESQLTDAYRVRARQLMEDTRHLPAHGVEERSG